jgi:hypothetical protein
MYADLFFHLLASSLEAYGIQTEPTPQQFPQKIPGHLLNIRPILEELDRNIISTVVWRYENVKIVDPGPDITRLSELPSPEFEIQRIIDKSKMGRPSTYDAAKDAFIILENMGITLQFNEVYRKSAVKQGLPETELSERTLRNHLKRFRQEVEKTGKK